ncbi:hypothetical protein N0V93_000412 [Gnomoniopsis smithogilvyi]|uniref:Uncharacterized protein n=1 Tax=Gnomoniopsis smithogilvyi TaxID=1191159 RepID=A0A9W8Z1R4_9PEZI|nr:hypothetical protein N0V93_000412 [Gnomoniopsis smithogilvyi]
MISQVCRRARHVALRSIIGITFISGKKILYYNGTFTEEAVAGTVELVKKRDLYVAHRLRAVASIPKHVDFGPFRALPTRVGHAIRAVADERVMIQTWYDTRRDTLLLRDFAHASPKHWRNLLGDESRFEYDEGLGHWRPCFTPMNSLSITQPVVHGTAHQYKDFANEKSVFNSIRFAGSFGRTYPWFNNGWTEFINPCISTSLFSRNQHNHLAYLIDPGARLVRAYRSEAIDSGLFGLWAENNIVIADLSDKKLLQQIVKLDEIQRNKPWPFIGAEQALQREILLAYRFSEQHEGEHPPGIGTVCRYYADQPCTLIDHQKVREILDSVPVMRAVLVFRLSLLPESSPTFDQRFDFILFAFLVLLLIPGTTLLSLLFECSQVAPTSLVEFL